MITEDHYVWMESYNLFYFYFATVVYGIDLFYFALSQINGIVEKPRLESQLTPLSNLTKVATE